MKEKVEVWYALQYLDKSFNVNWITLENYKTENEAMKYYNKRVRGKRYDKSNEEIRVKKVTATTKYDEEILISIK